MMNIQVEWDKVDQAYVDYIVKREGSPKVESSWTSTAEGASSALNAALDDADNLTRKTKRLHKVYKRITFEVEV